MTIEETFPKRLKEARERRRWSQAEVVRRLAALGRNLDKAAMSKIESGDRRVTLNEAVALAVALDVPLLSLLIPAYDEDVELAPELHVPHSFAVGWMSGRIPLSRDGVDSYRAAAKDIPDHSDKPHGLVVMSARSPNRDRAKEMLEAMAERERRELDELEQAAAARPEFTEAMSATMEEARKSLERLEQWTKEEQ